ncbi:hypothetical protein V8G54_013151 [Vigna mungo]|uniref:Uncharacterized protein n=1 Tax=Vigna mungo TaxID=3915 RepID=A0AAQ3NSQ7_VIGMU
MRIVGRSIANSRKTAWISLKKFKTTTPVPEKPLLFMRNTAAKYIYTDSHIHTLILDRVSHSRRSKHPLAENRESPIPTSNLIVGVPLQVPPPSWAKDERSEGRTTETIEDFTSEGSRKAPSRSVLSVPLSLFANLHSRTSSSLNFFTVNPKALLFSLSVFDMFLPLHCFFRSNFAIASLIEALRLICIFVLSFCCYIDQFLVIAIWRFEIATFETLGWFLRTGSSSSSRLLLVVGLFEAKEISWSCNCLLHLRRNFRRLNVYALFILALQAFRRPRRAGDKTRSLGVQMSAWALHEVQFSPGRPP